MTVFGPDPVAASSSIPRHQLVLISTFALRTLHKAWQQRQKVADFIDEAELQNLDDSLIGVVIEVFRASLTDNPSD